MGSNVFLEFHFYRGGAIVEQYLLVKAMDVISRFGSVGGKTTFKPTRRGSPLKAHHIDYGLLALSSINGSNPGDWQPLRGRFEEEMRAAAQRDPETSNLPALTGFWFLPKTTLFVHPATPVGGDSFNNLLGLADTNIANNRLSTKSWGDGFDLLREHLRGIPEHLPLAPSSKKVFSFGNAGNTSCARSWGYVLTPSLLAQLPGLLTSAGVSAAVVDGNTVLHAPIG